MARDYAPRHLWYAMKYVDSGEVSAYSLSPEEWPDNLKQVDHSFWNGRAYIGIYVDAPTRTEAMAKARERFARG